MVLLVRISDHLPPYPERQRRASSDVVNSDNFTGKCDVTSTKATRLGPMIKMLHRARHFPMRGNVATAVKAANKHQSRSLDETQL
jgi:hypothetical protein